MKSRHYWIFRGALLVLAWPAFFARADDASTNAAPTSAPPTAASLVDQATTDQADGKIDQALREATSALGIDPNNVAALDLRGSIYLQQKIWPLAERDYTALNKLSPDPAYQFKLGQIQYLQKHFDDARPFFAAIRMDSRLGDLARYKVFLCDLFGHHEAIAARDLGTLDTTGKLPSYYYGQGVWALFHNQRPAAQHLLAQAKGLFSEEINGLYSDPVSVYRSFHVAGATFTTKDGRKFDHAGVSLENDGLRATWRQGWVTVPLDQLPDDLSPFPPEMRDQIERRRHAVKATEAEAEEISFTTRSGKVYRQVHWSVGKAGLGILTPNGWTTIPFSDLPTDLSSFPATLREQIAAENQSAPGTSSSTVSFTTRQGKSFTDVRALLNTDGLNILTPQGWTNVAFADLPADLSPFPADWRPRIEARLKSRSTDDEDGVMVSFTTRQGAVYSNVRASLRDDGVLLVTTRGLRNIPFANLPADLTPFPADWRGRIKAWRDAEPDTVANTATVSFTTRKGVAYTSVRASLTDSGVAVATPHGWLIVSFADLPLDLSPFPSEWCTSIRTARKSAASNSSDLQIVSFTTTRGQNYDRVRAALDSTGLRVLGPVGWVFVSYDQLPNDLTSFPESWRSIIAAKQKEPAKSTASSQP